MPSLEMLSSNPFGLSFGLHSILSYRSIMLGLIMIIFNATNVASVEIILVGSIRKLLTLCKQRKEDFSPVDFLMCS